MDYQLIALDMDGTLLDSGKRVRPDVSAAVREAAAAGRAVAICSGRCPSMVELSRDDLGDVRYAICGSGTALYDLAERRVLEEFRLSHECVLRAIEACAETDSLFEVFHGDGFLYEIDHFCQLLRQGALESPLVPLDDTLACAKVFDQLRIR